MNNTKTSTLASNVTRSANSTVFQADISRSLTILESALPYIIVILCIGIIFSNCIVLAAFVKNPRLRTPFNTYLISLILADLAQAAFDMPFSAAHQWAGTWPLGRIGCNFYLYAKWMFAATVRNTHSLISLNRIWALFMPISYARFHTRTVAIWLCVGSWVYVHIFFLPGLVLDDLVYRVDDGTCWVNTTAQQSWALSAQIVVFNSTVVIAGISYPVIWWKVRQRRSVVPHVPHVPHMRPVRSKSSQRSSSTDAARSQRQTGSEIVDGRNSDLVRMHESSGSRRISTGHSRGRHRRPLQANRGERQNAEQKPERSSQAFAVLSYLVIGVIICWTPIMVYYTIQIVCDYDSYLFFYLGSVLYYLNSLLDPLFFTLAVTPLRVTILRMFHH